MTLLAQKRNRVLAIAMLMALCAAVYAQGLFGGFLFDDYPNIVRNTMLHLVDSDLYHWYVAAFSSNSGMLKRPVSMLSFAANLYGFGMNPLAFKLVNLAIHLFIGLLIYFLVLRLAPLLRRSSGDRVINDHSPVLAMITMALWLLHPLNVSDVVYIVQRMNQLAALFTLAGLLCYAEGRRRSLQGQPGLLIAFSGLLVFGLLAVFSKENGALIMLYALVIEAVCFRFRGAAVTRRAVGIFFTVCLGLPIVLFTAYLLTHPQFLSYASRDFDLTDRLLTQPRILMHYLQWIFIPLPSSMGIYHDDIAISRSLLTPLTTIVAIVGLAASAMLAWLARNRFPAFTFAVAWFLAGHAMESTLLPLEMVFEHRNYLPMTGLLMGAVIIASDFFTARNMPAAAGIVLAGILLIGLAGATAVRAHTWGDPVRLALTGAQNHPESPRYLYDAGRMLIIKADAQSDTQGDATRARAQAREYFVKASTLDPDYIFPSVSLLLTFFDQTTVPDAAVTNLARRIRHMRIFQATPVLMLLDAVSDGRVPMTPAQVERIVTAALDNSRAGAGAKAMILNNYGRYHYNRLNDKQAAVSLTLAATETDPGNPLLRINLANLAIAVGRYDIAARAIDKAEKLDKIGLYAKDIARIREEIASKSAG